MRRLRIFGDDDGIYFRHEEKYMRDPELREAYECGLEKGYEKAMREMEEGYGERRTYPRFGRDGLAMRDDERDWDEGYGERRRRRANGRFY